VSERLQEDAAEINEGYCDHSDAAAARRQAIIIMRLFISPTIKTQGRSVFQASTRTVYAPT
jgi:hypothetical protein